MQLPISFTQKLEHAIKLSDIMVTGYNNHL